MKNSNTPLVVAHPETGEVITMFKGKDDNNYGRVRVDSTNVSVNNNMTVVSRRTAFMTLTEQAIEALGDSIKAGQPYPIAGKLIVNESLEPFYEGQEPKTRGADGDVITHGGMPVYRDTQFTTNLEATDSLLVSDRVGVDNSTADNTANTKANETVE